METAAAAENAAENEKIETDMDFTQICVCFFLWLSDESCMKWKNLQKPEKSY